MNQLFKTFRIASIHSSFPPNSMDSFLRKSTTFFEEFNGFLSKFQSIFFWEKSIRSDNGTKVQMVESMQNINGNWFLCKKRLFSKHASVFIKFLKTISFDLLLSAIIFCETCDVLFCMIGTFAIDIQKYVKV